MSKKCILLFLLLFGQAWPCTTVTIGKKASSDGSVCTSHTCDSHRTRAALDVMPPKHYSPGAMMLLVRRSGNDSTAMPTYRYLPTAGIPQVAQTHGYINTAYPCINDRQLAIGESTFGGRSTLRSDSGLIDCQQLVALMLQRCATAREAIGLAGDLTAKYGYIDGGECLTIADSKEVWHLEILGAGKDQCGSIWAAQRVPDDEVSVNANGSRIRQIDLHNPDFFMASPNVFSVARDSGWWQPNQSAFEFCYAYNPEGRTSYAVRRREWRVLSLLAPSLKLAPESENYPFSVKPDTLVTLAKLMSIFQDYYENTDFDMTKNLLVADEKGKAVLSPLANPFMPYDMRPLFKINGGWGWRGERTIACWYTMYATITQSRDWLADPIGGVVWLAWDNVASSVYVPLYCGINDVAQSYKKDGRLTGLNRASAWWAFNYSGTLAAQRWGDMRNDVQAVWHPLQKEMLDRQADLEKKAVAKLEKEGAKKLGKFLTEYSIGCSEKVVQKAWDLGDWLFTKYDEKF